MKSRNLISRLMLNVIKVIIYIFSAIPKSIISIFGTIFAIVLYTNGMQDVLVEFDDYHTIFLTITGLVGTSLVLIISLSLIPIQRAVEVYTPSIMQQYRNDKVTSFIIISLALLCIVSLLFGIEDIFTISYQKVFPLSIILLAVSFDLLRWYYRHVSNLLIPATVLKNLMQSSIKYLEKLEKKNTKISKKRYEKLSNEKKEEQSVESIQTSLYLQNRNHVDFLNKWIGEIREIINKSIEKKETFTSEKGVNAIAKTLIKYLTVREGNLLNLPAIEVNFMASKTDAEDVISPFYDKLYELNRSAITNKNETASIQIIRALEEVACFVTKYKIKIEIRENMAPLAHTPIYYIGECVKISQQENLDDPALNTGDSLLRIGVTAPKNINTSDVIFPLIKTWSSISQRFIVLGKRNFVGHVMTSLMKYNMHLLKQEHYGYNSILGQILSAVGMNVKLLVDQEKIMPSSMMEYNFTPYSIIDPYSISGMIRVATFLIKVEPDNFHNSPFYKFHKINKVTYRHFRNIADNIKFDNCHILWSIIKTIKEISKVYVNIIDTFNEVEIRFREDILKDIDWYQSFFWAVFSNSNIVVKQYALDACDAMATNSMMFCERGFNSVCQSSISNINSILKSYIEKTKKPNPYDVADIMEYLWQLRLYVEYKKNKELLDIIDGLLDTKPESYKVENWQEVLEAFYQRKDRLFERMNDYNHYGIDDDSESLLRSIIKKK